MNPPARPPSVRLDEIGADKVIAALERVAAPTHEGRYVHWDKLRHLQPPGGINHQQWWFILKMRRRGLLKDTPLRDPQGQPFQFGLPDPALELLHEIDQGGGGWIALPEQVTNPSTRDRYVINSLMEESIRSSQLEGAATTREVAKEMIRSGRPPRDRSERMILNNFLTMRRIRDLRETDLAPEVVFDLHRRVTADTLDNPGAAGRFRRAEERIRVVNQYEEILHEPPPAAQLPARLEALCAFANGQTPGTFVHPVIRAIILHFWLAYDHPFVDGNGRTARALFYWAMLRHRYWLFEFISISQTILKAPVQYGRAFLYTETDENDLTYFVLYHLDVIRRAVGELHDYLQHKIEETQVLERELSAAAGLNHRQRALIGHALRHPDTQYTIESHQQSHGVVYQTARADLLSLARKGLLRQQQIGRTYYFSPGPALGKRPIGRQDR